jgi:hypothetical protein
MVANWLYQVRIKVNTNLSDALRKRKLIGTSKEIYKIAEHHGTIPVCTYDAFCEYCNEAEREGIDEYPLYDWTKQVIEDPIKKQKHTKSFAFYIGNTQVYEKSIAESLHTDLLTLYEAGLIEDLTLIDSNPQNNPQPPEKIKEN